MRYLRVGLAVLILALLYDMRGFRNMATQEAMDAAQLARNVAQGKGWKTQFVRPLSMHLLQEVGQTQKGIAPLGRMADYSQIQTAHPDIANPPAYPIVLAGLMKILPFEFTLPAKPVPFWSPGGHFTRYQPDFLIAIFNQVLFLITVILVFLLARRLFDAQVAWVSALLFLASDLMWRFTVSGLSTTFLLLIFVSLAWCLALLDRETTEPRWGSATLYVLSAVTGLLVGAGALTRYSFGWLIIPAVAFVVLLPVRQRFILGAVALVCFLAALGPWVARNYVVSGTPFGTATYTVIEGTYAFPGTKLQRSLNPDLVRSPPSIYWNKFFQNGRQILQNDLPKLSGSWASAFFLVGLLVGLRHPGARRLRYFLVGSLACLCLVQALGRTYISEASPELNSENLIVLLTPFVLLYGTHLFFLLLDQIAVPAREIRYAVIGLFAAVVSLPMILFFLPPRNSPIVYPYYPNYIELAAKFARADEWIMSDIPWAVAWYGQRQCVWLTSRTAPPTEAKSPEEALRLRDETVRNADFFNLNDYQKPIQALYISHVSLGDQSLSMQQWLTGGEENWGDFVLTSASRQMNRQPAGPPGFPLVYLQPIWPTQFLLTARPRPVMAD